jgi:hypothetical protein
VLAEMPGEVSESTGWPIIENELVAWTSGSWSAIWLAGADYLTAVD